MPELASTDGAILRVLNGASLGLLAAEIAEAIGLHVTTTRAHLQRLLERGSVIQRDERVGVGRPRKRYYALPLRQHVMDVPRSYHLLTEVLASVLGGSPEKAEAAVAEWALKTIDLDLLGMAVEQQPTWPEKVAAVRRLLIQWGYEPSVTSDGDDATEIKMATCPFRAEAGQSVEVVCGAHRGLLKGVLKVLGEPGAEVDLQPFAQGTTCFLRLSRSPGDQGESND